MGLGICFDKDKIVIQGDNRGEGAYLHTANPTRFLTLQRPSQAPLGMTLTRRAGNDSFPFTQKNEIQLIGTSEDK